MKKFLSLVIFMFGIWVIAAVTLFVFNDIRILETEEQEQLKNGKLFWQWYSDHGPLAMHYVEKGEGDNHLILLHGFRSHSYTWQHILEPLAEKGYHVFGLDLVGYGLSDKPQDAVYNVDFFIQQVSAFMEAHDIRKAHLVGNSMGGGLALSLALTHPEKVRSLSLLAALGYPLDLPLYLSICSHIDQIWTPFLGPTMVRYALEQVIYDKDKISSEKVDAYSLPYRFPGGLKASLLTLQNFDNQRIIEMGKRYPTLSHPMLVVWGEHDTLLPLSHYEKFLKDFPSATSCLIPGCGHIPQEESPNEVLSALLPFLQRLDK